MKDNKIILNFLGVNPCGYSLTATILKDALKAYFNNLENVTAFVKANNPEPIYQLGNTGDVYLNNKWVSANKYNKYLKNNNIIPETAIM